MDALLRAVVRANLSNTVESSGRREGPPDDVFVNQGICEPQVLCQRLTLGGSKQSQCAKCFNLFARRAYPFLYDFLHLIHSNEIP